MRFSVLLFAAALATTACASGDESVADTTTPSTTPTTNTIAPSTTTTSTTTTTAAPLTPLEALGYPVSSDWVLETVVSGIDSATGGLAVGPDGFFYQADFGYADHPGDTVYKISPEGDIEVLIQSDDLEQLTMTAFGPDGALYQTAYGSGQVLRIDEDGTFEVLAEKLRGPTGIVIAEDGTLYVDSYAKDVIYRITADGVVEDWVSHGAFSGVNGLTQGPDGTLYVINHKDGGLFAVDAEGSVTNLHKFPKATSHGVYLDGSIFVTSRSGYVVFRYDLASGDVEIVVGSGEAGDQDGRGGEASFGRPNAITVGPDGALYINHGVGNTNDPVTIRKISFQPLP